MSDTESELNPRTYEGAFIGDAPYPSLARSFDDSISVTLTNDYKMTYAPTMESQIRRLRLTMEEYRELILNLYNIFLWEKQWHPTAILSGCTVLFMILWLMDPTVLTILSIAGLVITIGDYILPTLVSSIFKNEDWNPNKQKQYEEICTNVVLYKTKFELLVSSYYRMRITNSKMYFTVTIMALSILSWVGSTVNNLFLSYLFVTAILLLPGMMYNGFLNRGTEALSKIFTDLVENAKSKVSQKKLD